MEIINQTRTANTLKAIDELRDIQFVNMLLQAIATKMPTVELTEMESQGLGVVLEWQNQRMEGVAKLLGSNGMLLVSKQAA